MNLEDERIIEFELLGGFACSHWEEAKARNHGIIAGAGKKVLSFLQYLIVHHTRHISADELIGQFWTEKNSADPANSLKNMVFKTRNLLKQLFPDQENLLITQQGGYAWNGAVEIRVDVEVFADLCLKARKQSGEDYIATLRRAASLYKGDFLSGNEDEWVVPQRRYYQTLYLDICKLLLPLLQEREQWTEIISICEQATAVDFSVDVFAAYQMQALISMGHPERAMDVYETFRKALWEEFEIEPTGQVEQTYLLARGMCQKHLCDQDILKLVAEGGEVDDHAFLCTFSVFQNIVALERRHLERSGHSSSIVFVGLGHGAVPTTDARRLERVLLEGLRTADPVARLDATSYILLLTGANVESAQTAIGRIDRMFHRTYTHSKADISYKVFALQAPKRLLSEIS